MKYLAGIFIKGIFVLAPVLLTFLIFFSIYEFTDGLFREILEELGFYFPGLGALLTVGIILLAGLLASYWLTNLILEDLEGIIGKIPLFGRIYVIIKDTLNTFSHNNRKGFTRLVRVSMPGKVKLLGFVTNDEDKVFIPRGYVAVYLMQSMQIAGNLILVPEEMVEPVEAPPEEALKFIASAGLLKARDRKVDSPS